MTREHAGESHAAFDGLKDMFKYYFNLTKYKRTKNVALIVVYTVFIFSLAPV